MPVKIFLVEDQEIVLQGMKSLLNGESNITVTGEASNGAEALEKLQSGFPDMLLMDMSISAMNGLECIRTVKQQYPNLKILVLCILDQENYLMDLLDAGADGYILKNSTKEELVFAIEKIANHGSYRAPEFTLNICADRESISQYPSVIPVILSRGEKEVLDLVADGLTNSEIALKLCNSIRTIETRRKNLLEKTGTTNTATLIRFAVQNRLIK
jgi:DNA-binding NarL/FixJ family response regulator